MSESPRELERTVELTSERDDPGAAHRLLEALGPAGVVAARRQALNALEQRGTRRTREVLRALDVIDEALDTVDASKKRR